MYSDPFAVGGEKFKKVNRKLPRGMLRGAEFMRDASAFSLLPGSLSSGATSVATSSRPRWLKQYRLWWREQLRCYEHSGLIKVGRRPLTWAKAPTILKLEFYHHALPSFGEVRTFTLRLRADIEAKAKKRRDPGAWMNKRIARELEKALGRPCVFIGCFEEDRLRGLHVHGEFVVTDNELVTARRALRLAGGEWERARQKQVKCHPYSPNEGWASYCGKNLHMASPFVRELLSRHGSPKLLVSYSGNPLFVSRELGRRARTLFDATRLAML
jgi:hypothetical protein